MKQARLWIMAIFLCSLFGSAQNNSSGFTPGPGPYFGQKPPYTVAEIFAPGIVSTGLEELEVTFMPDGRECYWSIMLSGFETILTSKLENGKWSEPEVAPFAGKYYDGWPAIQPDGKRMFFHSARPHDDSAGGITAKYNIWYVDRIENGWSEPKIVGEPVNGSENSTCPSLTKNGTIYISKRFKDDTEKLCRSEFVNGAFRELEILPAHVNALKYNFHGAISPDESYIIRPLYGRKDTIGSGWNYYVSFRNHDGQWSDLINLGKEINSIMCAGASSFSPDGKYLFFQARIPAKNTLTLERKNSLKELLDNEIRNPAKGSADIYWIDAKFIEALKPGEKTNEFSIRDIDKTTTEEGSKLKTIRMEEMTAPAINAAIALGYTTAVVGVGSTEQHGPHLPTMTDTRIAEELVHRVALKLGNALQARTIPVGISDHHLAFGGTISLQPATMKMIIRDYILSLSKCGFKRIVFMPCHGGNFATVEQTIKESQATYPQIKITGYTDMLGFGGFLNSAAKEFGVFAYESGDHAGESETSIMMALENGLVLRDKFEPGYMSPFTRMRSGSSPRNGCLD